MIKCWVSSRGMLIYGDLWLLIPALLGEVAPSMARM